MNSLLIRVFVSVVLEIMSLSCLAQGQTFNVLYSFSQGTDGYAPHGTVVRDSSGNLYGTTAQGGANQWGTVYKLDSHGNLTVLYDFAGGADGGAPFATLIRDSAGNLYGTTDAGGNFTGFTCASSSGCGVIFKVNSSGNYSVLYRFNGTSDGAHPAASLILDAQGNLYGVSYYGGNHQCFSYGCGTVFKLDAQGKFTTLHKFNGGGDGMFPQRSLVRDAAGNLFGMTYQGGDTTCNCGTIFRIDASGKETVLHKFGGAGDGKYPPAGLTVSGSLLYGTTRSGGASDLGTVFKIDKSNHESVVYSFTGKADGSQPVSSLLRDPTGNLYGTTLQGGSTGWGTVFKVDASGNESVLHNFSAQSDDGRTPTETLIRDGSGNLYGVAGGGTFNLGIVYKIAP